MKLLRKLTYPHKVDIRYHSRFFVEAVHETTHVSSENMHIFTVSGHRQTYQNYQQPPHYGNTGCEVFKRGIQN